MVTASKVRDGRQKYYGYERDNMIHLVVGGARSGKSSYAEAVATQQEVNKNVIYIATATAEDDEMRERISFHKRTRPSHWQLVEEPFYLSKVINKYNQNENIILIDCLTLWMSNWICAQHSEKDYEQNLPHQGCCKVEPKNSEKTLRKTICGTNWDNEKECFIKKITNSLATIILVSNEVGSGVVPLGNLSREFVDQSGWMNQLLSKVSTDMTFVLAGMPIALKTNKQLTNIVRPTL